MKHYALCLLAWALLTQEVNGVTETRSRSADTGSWSFSISNTNTSSASKTCQSASFTWSQSNSGFGTMSGSASATPSTTRRSTTTTFTSTASTLSASVGTPSSSIRHSRSSVSPSKSSTMTRTMSGTTSRSLSCTASPSTSPSIHSITASASRELSGSNYTRSSTTTGTLSNSTSPSSSASASPTATTITPMPPATDSLVLSTSMTQRSPSTSASKDSSPSATATSSIEKQTVTTSASNSSSFTPSETPSLSVTDSPEVSTSPSTSLTLSPTRSASHSNSTDISSSLTLSPEPSTTSTRSNSQEHTNTLTDTASLSSSVNSSVTPSFSSEPSSTITESMYLLENVTMVFDSVWATTIDRASPSVYNPSEAFQIYPDWTGAVVSHDSLRASSFVVFFHVRADVAHRYFAAAPPVPISLVGPSTVTSKSYQAQSAIGITMAAVSYNRFENRQFVMCIGPAPWMRIVEPFYFNVTVRAHPSLVSASVQEAVASTAAAVSIVFLSPLGALMQSRAIIMTSIVVCQEMTENNLFSILNVGVGDEDAGYYQRGAVAGNFGIVALASAVPLGIGVLTTIVARPKRRETTWQRCCDIMHLPSVFMVPAQLMIMPTIASSVALIAQWGSHADISVGATGVTATIVYLSFLTYSTFTFAGVTVTARDRPVPHVPTRVLEPVYLLFAGQQHWAGRSTRWKSWKRQYYYLFSFHDRRAFFTFETWAHTLVACLAGVVLGDTTYCAGHHIVIAVLSLVFMVLHIVLQPLTSIANHTIVVFIYGLWLCGAVCACAGMLLGYGTVSTTLLDTTTIANLITMCLGIFLAVPRGLYMILHVRRVVVDLWSSTEFRFPKDRQKVKPYDPDALPAAAPDTPIIIPLKPPRPKLPPAPPLGLPPPPKRLLTIDEMRAVHRRDLAAFANLGVPDVRSESSCSSTSTSNSSAHSTSSSSSDSSLDVDMNQEAPIHHNRVVEVLPESAPPQLQTLANAPPLARFKSFAANDDDDDDDDPFAGFDSASPPPLATGAMSVNGAIAPSLNASGAGLPPSRFDMSLVDSEAAMMGGSYGLGATLHSMDVSLSDADDDFL